MRKWTILSSCVWITGLSADPSSASVEVKAGYFFFVDSIMRDVYSHGGYDIQLSRFDPFKTWGNQCSLGIYSSVEYLHCDGKSLNDHEHTSIWELPISLGIQPIFRIGTKCDYYFALGPRFFYVHQHNHSHFVNRTNSRGTFGAFFNTGFRFNPIDHLLIDVFGEYSYGRVHIGAHKPRVYSTTRQIGGCVLGVGLGYCY